VTGRWLPIARNRRASSSSGGGFGGIGLGAKLKKRGIDDFLILEKSNSVGGVWHNNRYPGAACDVPAHLYSFSFEPKADWSQKYATQPEILAYLIHCARKYGLEPHLRLGTEVAEARWEEARGRWIVTAADGGLFEAQALIAATGQLSRPFTPQILGAASFSGRMFHSAECSACDWRGRSVAVIGTGATAIQLVPAIAPLVSKLYLFQRSAAYVLPKRDRIYPRWQIQLYKCCPGVLRLSRLLTYLQHEQTAFAFVTWRGALRVKRRAFFRHLQRGIGKAELRERLVPDYRLGCKRMLLSNDFYPAMDRANVELVTERIREIRPGGIVTEAGIERPVDCIVFATGFAAADFLAPIRVIGLQGQELQHAWKSGAEAYLGMTVAGFPNFFMLYGPNTNLAHNSIVFMLESQISYVLACLARLARGERRSIEVKQSAQQRFNARIQRRLQNAIWSKGCTSWYLNVAGKNTSIWPGYSFMFRLQTRVPNWNDYAVQS
jgi:cation diffusion facilitator CzcD-associated flavoprotein CzcO